MKLEQKIEALLFFKASPVSVSWLSNVLAASVDDVRKALAELSRQLEARSGLRLIIKECDVLLVTAPEMSDHIEALKKEEISKDIGKAGYETLAIILYRGPVTRAEIDYIRGVNSTATLRMLLIRGLIERVTNPRDQRGFMYKPSFELFQYLGITRIEELPEFDTVKRELEAFETRTEEDEQHHKSEA